MHFQKMHFRSSGDLRGASVAAAAGREVDGLVGAPGFAVVAAPAQVHAEPVPSASGPTRHRPPALEHDDEAPVRQARDPGHAVPAAYMYSNCFICFRTFSY